jgi:adenylylsulfate kinase-like enzyme
MVIWLTGISGSGKKTLASTLARLLRPRLPNIVILDGDVIRQVFGADLGYSAPERITQIKRLQALAAMLESQDIIVIVAAVYSTPETLHWNRANFRSYYEIYLAASLELVRRRDTKNLYRDAAAGRMANVVGMDIPWLVPQFPDLTIDADSEQSPEEMAFLIAQLDAVLDNAFSGSLSSGTGEQT